MKDDERITFEVPTQAGMVRVDVPVMSAAEAATAAARVAGVIRAMFAVVDDPPPHLREDPR